MTTKYGVFGETARGVGEPFADSVKPDARDRGLNFKVSAVCKAGKGKDATFGPLQPLFAGEPFVEPLRSALQHKNASRARNVTDKAWKAASPMKASACPGDWAGTLQGAPLAYEPGSVDVKLRKGEVPSMPPNIRAGLANTATARQQAASGIAGEYEYIADPIHQATRKPAPAEAAVPFRPVGAPKKGGPGTVTRHLGARPHGALGEFAWVPRPDQQPSSSGGADAGQAAAAAQPGFKPASLPHKGRLATFNRFPEYLHDPEERKAEARRAQLAKEREQLGAHGAWRPGGQVKSDACRSIIRMNL